MKRRRREAQSSTLSFMDCICCGFGAILLLFILTAKRQITLNAEEASQRIDAVRSLEEAIGEAVRRSRELDAQLAAADLKRPPEGPSTTELAAAEARLKSEIEEAKKEIAAMQTTTETSEDPAAMERPSADRAYLAGLQLRGPRVLILLESSGSMLAENAAEALDLLKSGSTGKTAKWLRAKAAVRSVLAALPKGTRAAVYGFAESASPVFGDGTDPWFDPYENSALLGFLSRLDSLQAGGGADLAGALRKVAGLRPAPSSILLITDGLPSAPSGRRNLSEADRVDLLRRAVAAQQNIPFNVLLLPFEGDPAAAGLYWQMSGRTLGVTIVPDKDWPPPN
jgi:hypothetical protein